MPKLMEVCGHTFIASLIEKDALVVDLGANEGAFTSAMSSTFGCNILAIEPVPELYAKIPDNARVKKLNSCIAARNEPIMLNVPFDRCASIYQHAPAGTERSIIAQGVRIDSILDSLNVNEISLMKVDIEGAEIELFSSISMERLQTIRQLTVEFHDFLWNELRDQVELIKRRMKTSGFYCIPFSRNNGDVLFARRNVITHSALVYLHFAKYVRGVKRQIRRRVLAEQSCHSVGE